MEEGVLHNYGELCWYLDSQCPNRVVVISSEDFDRMEGFLPPGNTVFYDDTGRRYVHIRGRIVGANDKALSPDTLDLSDKRLFVGPPRATKRCS